MNFPSDRSYCSSEAFPGLAAGFSFFCSAQCMLAARLGASLRADLSDALFCQVPLTCDRNATASWAGCARRPDDNRRCGTHLSRVWEFRCGAARCFPGMKMMLRRITMCICSRLQAAGCKVVGDGDVAIPAIFHIIPFRTRGWDRASFGTALASASRRCCNGRGRCRC
jgi:hypothetical protein